jgi:apolipoprotein N-acyltransferase
MSHKEVASLVVASGIGISVASAHPLGIAVSVAMPALIMRQKRRRAAYAIGVVYYSAALWPLVPGARNFFGPNVSILVALLLWTMTAAILAGPWLLVWSSELKQGLWRAPIGVALTVVPPLGIIGWASPVLAAGILFPATGWSGFLLCAALTGALAVWPRRAAMTAVIIGAIANFVHPTDPQPPAGWVAVDTHFGPISHGEPNPLAEYQAAQVIQQEALRRHARVIVFPETVVPYWTASTDAFWEQTLVALRANGKTMIVGARIPEGGTPAHRLGDFATSVAVLRSDLRDTSAIHISGPKDETILRPRYTNAMVVRGAQSATVAQRVPVPIAMWNPFREDSAQLSFSRPGLTVIENERTGTVICYEQLIVWPVLITMIQHPTVLVAPANDYWAMSTTIPTFQRTAMRSWARLFGIPCLFAVNT